MKITLTQEEIDMILASLSWTANSESQAVIKLKNKLNGIDNTKKV